MKKFTAAALVAGAMVSFSAAQGEELTIATVNIGHMIEMQKLSSAAACSGVIWANASPSSAPS